MNTTSIYQPHYEGRHPQFAVAILTIRNVDGSKNQSNANAVEMSLELQRALIADLAMKQKTIITREQVIDLRIDIATADFVPIYAPLVDELRAIGLSAEYMVKARRWTKPKAIRFTLDD